ENTCQFHHQRSAGTIVIRRLTEALPVQVGADDVHFVWVRGPDLRAIDLFARPRSGWLRLRIKRTKHRIGLGIEVVVGGRWLRHAAQSRSAHTRSDFPAGNHRGRRCRGSRLRLWRWIGDIFEALDIGATGGPKLSFDPVDRGLISIGALLTIA